MDANNTIKVVLTSRNGGDSGILAWEGPVDVTDDIYLAEARSLLNNDASADITSQTDDELLANINGVRSSWRKRHDSEQTEKDRISALADLAKKTGKRQMIRHYLSDFCHDRESDPDIQCSFDHVTVYITPKGKIIEEYTHCY
jgi:hypothetical protein